METTAMRLVLSIALLSGIALAQAALPANQASDNNVVVGNPAQPVQWVHKATIQQAILAAQPNGTVRIPATYTGTDCSPYSNCSPGNVLIIDERGGQFNTFPTGSGTCGSCVSTIFGRIGPVVAAVGTDYGGLSNPWTQVGNITSFFQSNPLGTLKIGNSTNFCQFSPTSGVNGMFCQDINGNGFGINHSGLGNYFEVDAGSAATAYIQSDLAGGSYQWNLAGVPAMQLTPAGLVLSVPCTGCTSNSFTVDQAQFGTGAGTSALFATPQGALAYHNFASGTQGLFQAAASDLSNGTSGSGPICLVSGCTLTNPVLNNATALSQTINGTGPTQWKMTPTATPQAAPVSGSTIWGVDAAGNAQISSNGGNNFRPGPSSSIILSLCGGGLGTTTGTNYIFWPANQNVTSCSSSSVSTTTQEIPAAVTGTFQNLSCLDNGGGNAGDIIKFWKNGAATSLQVAIGVGGATPVLDSTHTVSMAASDTWSIRYLTGQATDTATGMRCALEFVRTP